MSDGFIDPEKNLLSFPPVGSILKLLQLMNEGKSRIEDIELENTIRLLRVVFQFHRSAGDKIYTSYYRAQLDRLCEFKRNRIDHKNWSLRDKDCNY